MSVWLWNGFRIVIVVVALIVLQLAQIATQTQKRKEATELSRGRMFEREPDILVLFYALHTMWCVGIRVCAQSKETDLIITYAKWSDVMGFVEISLINIDVYKSLLQNFVLCRSFAGLVYF